jgi:hypothetical protein
MDPRRAHAPMRFSKPHSYASLLMSPTWIWLQGAIVVFVLIGMIIAITKLA